MSVDAKAKPEAADVQSIDLDSLLRWTKEKEIATKFGPRLLRTAVPDEAFWELWNIRTAELKAAGISVSQDPYNGNAWRVCWWRQLPTAVIEARKEQFQLSKAISADIDIPKPEGLEYMPFQKAGIRYCLNLFREPDKGAFIADEMGLGKTIQAIGLINAIPDISKVLVICPMTLKPNWHRELKRWLVRPMEIGLANADYFPRTDIILIHYDILWKFPTRLSNYWDLVIVDESQRLGNPKNRWTKMVVGYKPTRKEAATGMAPSSGIPARRKLLLSGTPFTNCPSELWPIISWAAPDLFSSKSAFEKRYCGACHNGFGYEAKGATNLEELGSKLREGFMVRRLKREVLPELPPKTRQIVEMDSSGLEGVIRNEQKVWHQHEAELETLQVEAEVAKTSDNDEAFKKAIEALRCKTALIFSEISKVRHETAKAKTPRMIDMLKEDLEQCGKAIVFAHHRDVLEASASAFPGECVLIHGETPQQDRDRMVQRFQNDPSCKVFFGSIRATGEGITLTAATTVIFFENDWTAAKMAQCSDRPHRIGQKGNVLVKYYILPGTIDAHMIQTWIQKEEILEKALDQDRPILAQEPVLIPKAQSIASRKELGDVGISLTLENRRAILAALRSLDSVCDGAVRIDGAGFNKFDSAVGKSLSSQPVLSPKAAALGLKILRKYRRQVGEDTLRKCGAVINEKEQYEKTDKQL